jgi:hypothetical protein
MTKTVYRICKETNRLVEASQLAAPVAEPKYDPAAHYDDYLSGPRSGQFMACKTCGGMHETSHWPHNCMPEQFDLAHEYAGIGIISDNLESIGGLNGIQCQASGLRFTSKSKMRREYKARGVIEVGNEPQRMKEFTKPKPDRKAIRDAVRRATWQVEHEGATATAYRKRAKRAPNAFGPVAK